MREIPALKITETVERLCVEACCKLPNPVKQALKTAKCAEGSATGQNILSQLVTNTEIAANDMVPICQDTGLTVVFIDIGQDVRITGGDLCESIKNGVRNGYVNGYLRKSVVSDPIFDRKNTADNTPPIIHARIVQGDKIYIRVAPKGAGSENKSRLFMLVPADGINGVRSAVLETVRNAGASSCPPMVVGVGIGGNMELACLLAKQAAMRDVGSKNKDPRYAQLEKELLEIVNKTGIGPQGLGGEVTALAVNVEWAPTHIASLPVAVNINCHAARHAEAVL